MDACDGAGRDLSCSPDFETTTKDSGWMIKTLSSELPRFDREEAIVENWAIHDKDLGRPKSAVVRPSPARDIVSTDLAGPAGYDPSPDENGPGTSASTSRSPRYFPVFSRSVAQGLAVDRGGRTTRRVSAAVDQSGQSAFRSSSLVNAYTRFRSATNDETVQEVADLSDLQDLGDEV